jgi:hypothetical protein
MCPEEGIGVLRSTVFGLAFKRVWQAQKCWRRTRGVERIAELLGGMVFKNGIPVTGDRPERQPMAA